MPLLARRPVSRRGLLVALASLLLVSALPRAARADRIETLAASLLTDPSWRVKVQAAITLGKLKSRDPRAIKALVESLRDDNEGVRAVSAEMLGKLGDRSALDPLRVVTNDESPEVRVAAKKAVALLEQVDPNQAPGRIEGGGATTAAAAAAPAARYYVEVSEVVVGKGDAEAAKKIREVTAREVGRLSGVTLDAAATSPKVRYAVDANITALKAGKPDDAGRVHTDCGVRLTLATLPEHSIRMMATLESSVEGSTDPRDLESARGDCLVDVGRQIAEKVGAFLESHK